MRKITVKQTNLPYNYSALETRKKTDQIVVHHTGNPHDDDLSANKIHTSHQAQG